MKQRFWLRGAATGFCLLAGLGARLAGGQEPAARDQGGGSIRAFFVADNSDRPIDHFKNDAPKISVAWQGQLLRTGDHITAVWIAEDLGLAGQRESKITEENATAYKPDDDGVFTLGRPKEGWPAGKYRIDLYLNDRLAQSLRFTIEPGASIEVH